MHKGFVGIYGNDQGFMEIIGINPSMDTSLLVNHSLKRSAKTEVVFVGINGNKHGNNGLKQGINTAGACFLQFFSFPTPD